MLLTILFVKVKSLKNILCSNANSLWELSYLHLNTEGERVGATGGRLVREYEALGGL